MRDLDVAGQRAGDGFSYIVDLTFNKPTATGFGAMASGVMASLSDAMPGHLISLASLTTLVVIDFITKYIACRKRGISFTSQIMREKGVFKLRDYFLLYIAAACTVPLMGEPDAYRAALTFMAFVEFWSIAENLYDAGTIPFDVRQVAMSDIFRSLVGRMVSRDSSTSRLLEATDDVLDNQDKDKPRGGEV